MENLRVSSAASMPGQQAFVAEYDDEHGSRHKLMLIGRTIGTPGKVEWLGKALDGTVLRAEITNPARFGEKFGHEWAVNYMNHLLVPEFRENQEP